MEATTVLTQTQRSRFLELAGERRRSPEFKTEHERRLGVSKEFREVIEDSRVLKGGTFEKDHLAKLIGLQWEIQNLNAIVLPQLLGTYHYYRFFKKFEGSESDFAVHMKITRPSWEEGSTGYPGADLDSLSADIRTMLLASDRSASARGLVRLKGHPGVGRAFASGIGYLYAPDQWPLVNNVSVDRFRNKGDFHISQRLRKELWGEGCQRFGLIENELDRSDVWLLGWIALLEDLRSLGEFQDFLQLDILLWNLTSQARKIVRDSQRISEDTSGRVLEEVERLLPSLEADRLRIRKESEDEARAIVQENLGHLTAEQVREVFRLLNVDHYGGEMHANRFSPAFTGQQVNEAVAVLEATNRWIERLWTAEGDELKATLDDFWSANEISGAGRSLPSGILYLRDPERFSVLMTSQSKGLARTTGEPPIRKRTGAAYLAFNRGVQALRKSLSLQPQAVDIVLWRATTLKLENGQGGPPEETERTFQGFSPDAFRFLSELDKNNNVTWFKANKNRYKELKQSLRALVEDLGRSLFSRLSQDVETTPKAPKTLSQIRKNIYGQKEKDVYWPHYWAAFHRRDRSKSEDFQLFIVLDQNRVTYGFFVSRVQPEEIARFRERIREHSEIVDSLIAKLRDNGFVFRQERAGQDDAPLSIANARQVADALKKPGFLIRKEHAASDTVVSQPELADRIESAFETLFPLYLLATSDQVEEDLSAYRPTPAPDGGGDGEDEDDVYSFDDLVAETLLGPIRLQRLEQLLLDKGQLILYGPPGTGKTWLAERFAKYFVGAMGEVRTVQFHPSFGYEDFIEGIRPVINDHRQVEYRVKDGVFKSLCALAARSSARFVLTIDEINRGNLPRVFGELLYLLERRGETVDLSVSGKPFRVPKNIFLIGTMNTADHSIALVDVALRRRFHFERLDPAPEVLREWLSEHCPDMISTSDLLTRLNDELRAKGIDPEQLIGHSHFMRPGLDDDLLERIWTHSVYPTIEEYFYGQPEKQKLFRYEDFVEPFTTQLAGSSDEETDDEN